MRDLFKSYYKPTDDEFNKIWQEGIFSFDTNVLLNVYRYTPDTRSRLFEILQRFYNRIWIPYQVAYEYHERRLDVISDQVKAADSIESQLSKSFSQIESELRRYKNHPFANVDQLTETIKKAVEKARVALREAKSNHPNFIRSDQLLDTLTELFTDSVGQPYPQSDLEELYKEIDQRYERKVPPGYEDAKEKKDERKYGDAIIWYQLIAHAKEKKKPLIFVTGERKEDWWLRHEGETIGPRRELIQEMNSEANVLFYMYSTDQFMEQAENFLGLHDQKGAVEEVRKIIRQDEANTKHMTNFQLTNVDNEDDIEKIWTLIMNVATATASSITQAALKEGLDEPLSVREMLSELTRKTTIDEKLIFYYDRLIEIINEFIVKSSISEKDLMRVRTYGTRIIGDMSLLTITNNENKII